MRDSRRYRSAVLLLIWTMATSCGGESSPSTGPTLAEVMARIEASDGVDRDGDYLPDEVETWLGTLPDDRDSDRDGMPDYAEVFGSDIYHPADRVPDRDGDQKLAPVDQDDDGDGRNDGEQVDSDGDTIPNYLEMYGYTHSPMTGKYQLWDGQTYDRPYFKSDPYQTSTDQDPYDDAMEVSGAKMDVSVRAPGTMPMVPAYPDLSVALVGYEVTVNEQITYSSGGSLASGTTWSRSTESTHSQTSEKSWEVGVTAEAKFPFSVGVSTSVNHGWKDSATNSTSTSQATGGSVLSTSDWSRATSSNPTDAARIKLCLKARNQGTAAASKVVPTLTLRIGGHSIATFEPGNAQINLIEANGVYPAADGVYWVVDTYDTGTGVSALSLTLTELQALENGAPVSVTLTQMAAEVVRLNPETGAYESHGDWNEYMARIKSVSAFLFADLGDGNLIRSYVYADDSPTAPVVTLADALVWAAGAHLDEQGRLVLGFWDQQTGGKHEVVMGGGEEPPWSVAFDRQTYEQNGYRWDEATGAWQAPDGRTPADLWQMRLFPGAVVTAKAPRESTKDGGAPTIHYALFDRASGSVTALAEDYDGIDRVELVDPDGVAQEMRPDVAGSNIYVVFPESGKESLTGAEKVRATNVKGATSEAILTEAYRPEFIKPVINKVYLDLLVNKKLIANVSWEGGDLGTAPAWVRAYHPGFAAEQYLPITNGKTYLEMTRADDLYKNPDGWQLKLPQTWTAPDLTIVAFGGKKELYSEYQVQAADLVLPHAVGVVGMHVIGGGHMPLVGNMWFQNFLVIQGLDLDQPQAADQLGAWILGDLTKPDKVTAFDWVPPAPGVDFWIRYEATGQSTWRFALHCKSGVTFTRYVPPSSTVTFESLTLADIQAVNPTQTGRYPADASQFLKAEPMIFLFKTSEGRYAKLGLSAPVGWEGAVNGLLYSNLKYLAAFVTYDGAAP